MYKFALLLPAALLAACASSPITSTVQSSDPAAFARARTFVVDGPAEGGVALDPELRAAITDGLTAGLRSHGYEPATGAADLRVAWQVAATGRVYQDAPARPALEAHTPIGPGDPYATYRQPGGADAGADAGILIVTIRDSTGHVVWQATGEGAATGSASAIRSGSRAARAVLETIPKSAAD